MKNFGLTNERYKQMMEKYNNDKEIVSEIVDEWGVENCNKGYSIFDFDGTGMLEVEAISDIGCFTDDEAAEMAIKDGINIIPIEELPENFNRRYLGWIDTVENRKTIENYCKQYC